MPLKKIVPRNLFLNSALFNPKTIYGRKRCKAVFSHPKINYTKIPGAETYIG